MLFAGAKNFKSSALKFTYVGINIIGDYFNLLYFRLRAIGKIERDRPALS